MKEHSHAEYAMFYEFLLTRPDCASGIVDYKEFDRHLLLISLVDGRKILWDDLKKTARYLQSGSWKLAEMSREVFSYEFGQRLSTKIYNYGYTIERVAELSGISRSMIHRYMNGKALPNIYNALRLAAALNCSLYNLLHFPREVE